MFAAVQRRTDCSPLLGEQRKCCRFQDRTHDRAKAALAPRNIANGGAIPLNKIAPITEALGKPHLRGCARSLRSVAALLKADLYRYAGKTDAKSFWKHFLFTPGYKYTVVIDRKSTRLNSSH